MSRTKTGQPSPKALTTPSVAQTSIQIAQLNLTRDGLRVGNPSSTATLWVAPDGTVAAAAGAGSIPIQPLQFLDFQHFTNSMNAVFSAGTSPVTVWELYE